MRRFAKIVRQTAGAEAGDGATCRAPSRDRTSGRAFASIRIATASEVYEAIIDPVKMSGYFIKTGSDRMEEGRTRKYYY